MDPLTPETKENPDRHQIPETTGKRKLLQKSTGVGKDGPFQDEEEKNIFLAALDSFRKYRKVAHYNVTHRRRQNFYALPSEHWKILSEPPFNLLTNLDRVDDAIDANAEIADRIVEASKETFPFDDESTSSPSEDEIVSGRGIATAVHLDKARSTIRQMHRDWSIEGIAERQACYDPVLQDLDSRFSQASDKTAVKVLVPGAGLGRLVFEICLRGYSVEGNEISWHQLMASNWILNHTVDGTVWDLYPFATDFSNLATRDQQLQVVKIPDLNPASALNTAFMGSEVPSTGRLGMTSGDFIELYGRDHYQNAYEAVITVFFIDTAPNLIRYVETVRNCLQPGGMWANLGPLLWHFEDRAPTEKAEDTAIKIPEDNPRGIQEPGSFELANSEVLMLVERMGFDIQMAEVKKDGIGYIHNAKSMLQNTYRVSHWVARKRA